MSNLEQCTIPRKQVNHSIKLASVTQFPSHHNNCICDMCNQYESVVLSKKLERNSGQIFARLKQKQNENRIKSLSFQYILRRLVMPTNKMITQALCIYIPEVCFYKDGEADSLFMNIDQTDKAKDNSRYDSLKEKKQQMIVRLKKQKLTNTQIQKIFNQKRRKYQERIGATKRKISRKVSQFEKKQETSQPKDAVIIAYNDGYEELQTQNQFINLTLKRKQDPIFKKIQFIKNFIGVVDEDKRIFIIQHEQNSCKYQKLFERSRTLMKCYATNIVPQQKEYINQQDQNKFLENLLRLSLDAYAHYTLYKIINYIQFFFDQRITEISVKFLLNQRNDLYLLYVYSHKKIQLVKYSWTQETYLKKVAHEQNKFLQRKAELPEHDEKGRARSNIIEKQMHNQYEQLKFMMGLAHVQKDDSQEKANNAFFSVIHPQLPNPISQILKDKGMSVSIFQEKYLGYRQKKRSVAQAFNSNLVKTLHKMSPPLKVAQGHQIQDKNFPKTPLLTNRTNKRSFSLGNTMSTVNKTMTIFL